jgi:ribosomal protein S18 acetylase RimI-like enzyme
MTIRILTLSDELLVPDVSQLFGRVLSEITPSYDQKTIDEARARYTPEEISRYLAPDLDKRFIGYFDDRTLDGLLIEGFDHKDGNRTTINWVMAGEKGKGIGTKLILDCLERARTEGKDNVTLGVSTKNVDARRLYEKLGFVSGGTFENKHGLQMKLMGYVF